MGRTTRDIRVGVLALQGDFAEHLSLLASCGYRCMDVRTTDDLERADCLVIPGGESTTMLKLIDRYEFRDPLSKRIEDGMPVLATCAGAILLAREVTDGEKPIGVLDVRIRRNAYGRQVDSFETEIEVKSLGSPPIKGIFIRAPIIEWTGPGVDVLATWADDPVLIRQSNILSTTFHPELAGEVRIHRYFVEEQSRQ